MIIFAGNFSLEKKIVTPELDFDIIELGETSYFIMWADQSLESSQDVVEFLTKNFWPLKHHDISIETEDNLEILSSEYEIGVYESVSFEWPEVDFDDLLERFAENTEAICIREAEISAKFWTKVVRVDFMY